MWYEKKNFAQTNAPILFSHYARRHPRCFCIENIKDAMFFFLLLFIDKEKQPIINWISPESENVPKLYH